MKSSEAIELGNLLVIDPLFLEQLSSIYSNILYNIFCPYQKKKRMYSIFWVEKVIEITSSDYFV